MWWLVGVVVRTLDSRLSHHGLEFGSSHCLVISEKGTDIDFHRAMMAIAPGEELLIERRPVRSWTQLQFFVLFPLSNGV